MPRPAPRPVSLPDDEARQAAIAKLGTRHGIGSRRAEILWLMLQGILSDKELGLRAQMAPSTVHGHIQELMVHFGVDARGRVVVEALRMEES